MLIKIIVIVNIYIALNHRCFKRFTSEYKAQKLKVLDSPLQRLTDIRNIYKQTLQLDPIRRSQYFPNTVILGNK